LGFNQFWMATKFKNAAGEKCQIIGSFEISDGEWVHNIKNLETHIIHYGVLDIKVEKYILIDNKR